MNRWQIVFVYTDGTTRIVSKHFFKSVAIYLCNDLNNLYGGVFGVYKVKKILDHVE